jgi:tetratricopeptide (TPR) repeat protein
MSAPRLSAIRVLLLATGSLVVCWSLSAPAVAQDPLGGDAGGGLTDEAPAQPQQLTAEDVQKMFKDAETAIKEEDFQKALGLYDQLIRLLKQQGMQAQVFLPVVYTGRGEAFAGLDDPEAAKTDFDEALKENSTHLPALIGRGKLYLELGANDLAMADFEAAKEQDRSNPDVMFGLGKAYVLLGGPQQAIKPLTYAIESNDQNAEAYRLRAQAYSGVGKNEEANEDIQKSLSLDSEDYETYFALATVLLREEKYPEAIDAIEDAIKRYKPKEEGSKEPFAQGYLTKAAFLVEAAKNLKTDQEKTELYEKALAECDKLLELTDDSPAYASIRAAIEFRRGIALRLLGRYGDAVAALTEAVNLNPDLAEAFFRRGICFYYMGEDDLAVLDFKHAGNIEYQDPRPKLWEGFAYAKLGNYHEAIRCYGSALAESDRYVPAYVNRGLAYMMLGENQKALSDFNAALRLEPAEWTHYFKRGIAYERLGQQKQAADSFVAAVRFYDKYPPAYRHAATALASLGHNELASEYRSKAAEVEAELKKQQATQQ